MQIPPVLTLNNLTLYGEFLTSTDSVLNVYFNFKLGVV